MRAGEIAVYRPGALVVASAIAGTIEGACKADGLRTSAGLRASISNRRTLSAASRNLATFSTPPTRRRSTLSSTQFQPAPGSQLFQVSVSVAAANCSAEGTVYVHAAPPYFAVIH